MHQIMIVIEPGLLFVEQNKKVVTLIYKDGHGLRLTFSNANAAREFYNEGEFEEDMKVLGSMLESIQYVEPPK